VPASPTTPDFTGRPSNVAPAAVHAPAQKGTRRRTQSLFRQLVNGPRDSQRHQPILQLGFVHGQSEECHEGPRSAADYPPTRLGTRLCCRECVDDWATTRVLLRRSYLGIFMR
jgi:hypothetical protein